MENSSNLFDRIGGMDAIEATLDIFYDKVTKDDSVSDLIQTTDVDAWMLRQRAYFAYTLGADLDSATFMESAEKTAPPPLTEDQFHTLLGHMIDSLRDLNVPEGLIDEVVELAMEKKPNPITESASGL